MKKIAVVVLAIIFCSTVFTGCTSKKNALLRNALQGTEVSSDSKKITISLQKDLLEKSWVSQSARTNSIRLVEVFSPNATIPTHYIFDVKPNSIYEHMGLREKDILLGVENYPVTNPTQFIRFARVLPQLDSASVFINRGGQVLEFDYQLN